MDLESKLSESSCPTAVKPCVLSELCFCGARFRSFFGIMSTAVMSQNALYDFGDSMMKGKVSYPGGVDGGRCAVDDWVLGRWCRGR